MQESLSLNLAKLFLLFPSLIIIYLSLLTLFINSETNASSLIHGFKSGVTTAWLSFVDDLITEFVTLVLKLGFILVILFITEVWESFVLLKQILLSKAPPQRSLINNGGTISSSH